jgi:tripartite-type tricarboxylate transporter receptor subunit TctC
MHTGHHRSLHRRGWLAVALSRTLGGLAAQAHAQDTGTWPDKPIRVIVPYPAGGNADAIGRFIANKLGIALGQSLVVDNKGGAGGTIGAEAAARAAPDGYTLFVSPNAVFTITQHLRAVPYDPENDFVPIARLSGSYSIAAARKDAPFNNLAELFAAAAKEPGKYTFGSAGPATSTHLSGEMIAHAGRVKLMHVPYKGSAPALADLMGGRIDLMFDPVSLPQVKAGTVKAIALLSKNRHPELPDVPTAREQDVDLDTRSWFGLFAPKGTPQPIVDRLAREVEKILAEKDTAEALLKFSQHPDFLGPQAFAAEIRNDSAFFKDLIRTSNIRAE